MNLDLLKKLTRLANNNPNDNEANSAARRVCKMLEQANFNLGNGSSPPPRQREAPQSPTGRSYDYETREADVNFNPFEEFFKSYYSGRPGGPFRSASNPQGENPFYKQWVPPDPTKPIQLVDYDEKRNAWKTEKGIWIPAAHVEANPKLYRKRTKEKRPIKCTRCGNSFMSSYIGNLFVCHQCHWDEYQKESTRKEEEDNK